MFFKTTISSISNTNPLFNFSKNNATEYVFNVRYLSNIVSYGLGSSFVLINDYDRRGRDIYFESSTSVVDIIDEMDSPSANGYYTLNYFKNDNPAKAVLNRDIPIDHIIALFAYWNPSYTWLVFDSYNSYRRVLINDTLDNILASITTPTTTLATTTSVTTTPIPVTTVAPTTAAPTTPAPTTTLVTTTPMPTTTLVKTTLAPTTTPIPTTTPAPTTLAPTTTPAPTTLAPTTTPVPTTTPAPTTLAPTTTPTGTTSTTTEVLDLLDGLVSYWKLDETDVYTTTTGEPTTAAPTTLPPTTTYHTTTSTTTTTSNASTLLNDIEAYWKLDETSGSTVYDAVNNNDGTVKTNVTVNQTGKLSKCCTFESDYSNGVTQGIWCGTDSSLNLTTAGTISAWIYFRGGQYAGVGCIAGTLDADTERYGYMLMSDEDASGNPRITVKLATSSAIQTFRNTTAYSADTWVHVVGAWDASNIYIWINGANKQSTSRTRTPDNTSAEFCIGRSRTEWQPKPWGWGRTNGDALDEIGVWSRCLTDDEVTELYNSGSGITYPF